MDAQCSCRFEHTSLPSGRDLAMSSDTVRDERGWQGYDTSHDTKDPPRSGPPPSGQESWGWGSFADASRANNWPPIFLKGAKEKRMLV
jgi:hypothetical protein